MTPDQIEMLRPGMEISIFSLDFETKPPYRIDAELRTEVVQGITRGKGSTKVHTRRPRLDPETGDPVLDSAGQPEYLPEPGVYTADKVFATLESASKACLECMEGLASGITRIRKNFRAKVKAERLALRGESPAGPRAPAPGAGEDAPEAAPKAKGRPPGRPRKPRPEDPAPQADLPLAATPEAQDPPAPAESPDILRPAAATREDHGNGAHPDPDPSPTGNLVNALA